MSVPDNYIARIIDYADVGETNGDGSLIDCCSDRQLEELVDVSTNEARKGPTKLVSRIATRMRGESAVGQTERQTECLFCVIHN